ncbi:MarR family winged helix-turn-helix transcriptional regulator [Streptomyces niveiscabiei]|uniref:MarR family winged helix-turn-helix transcriptional regulator n=1 Tax=Streptomyces niveiscabiei TaxID=164115 RepID=A0ABW9HX93_9ACTN
MEQEVRWLTTEEQQAWRGFLRLHDRLRGHLTRQLQGEANVSVADFAVLVELTDLPEGRRRILDLARSLEWEKSRMSHHIARMVKRGLVVRDECLEDGRGAFVVITDEGRRMIEAAAPRHVEAVRGLFLDHVTPAELRVIAEVSERVVRKIDEAPECPTAEAD